MTLPFTEGQFLRVFELYNAATWPAAIILPALGVLCVALLFRRRPSARRAVLLILGALWTWTAIAYHLRFFQSINPAARWLGVMTLIQAVMFFFAMFGDIRPSGRDVGRIVGGALMGVALVVYPLVGYLAGHRYPVMATFGLPCPTTIFTIGVLAWMHDELSWKYAVIPLFWALVGSLAALELGMVEDMLLPGAAIAFFVLAVAKARSLGARLPARG
jgi:hypothetical protein